MVTYTTAIIHAFSPSKHVLGDQLTHGHIHYSYYPCFQPLKTCTRWSTNSCSHTLQLLSMPLSAPQNYVLGDQLTHAHIHYSYYPCFQPLKTCTRWSTNSWSHTLQLLSMLSAPQTCTRWSTNSCSYTTAIIHAAPQNMYSVINCSHL